MSDERAPAPPLAGVRVVVTRAADQADALVGLIRAGAGIGEFSVEDAEEMVRYATRRGLLDPEEGERVLDDINAVQKAKSSRASKKPKAAKTSRSTKRAPTRKK